MNASSALMISTPDGSGQAVHPDVIYLPEGFRGYRYWLAMTPFPFGDARVENPFLRVSNDGLRWSPLDGVPDPIVQAPESLHMHHADTDLSFDGGSLQLLYMTRDRLTEENTFSLVCSQDALIWSTPQVVAKGKWIVSPAAVFHDSNWRMYYVRFDVSKGTSPANTAELLFRSGPSLQQLGSEQSCLLDLPGHTLWHVDVISVNSRLEALAAAFPHGTHPSRCRLFHAVSSDGRTFSLSSKNPVLRPRWRGWDNRMIYRSTFVSEEGVRGRYKVWYSGASWAMRCGIGMVQGSLDDLRAPRYGEVAVPAIAWWRKALEDMRGFAVYILSRYVPTYLYNLIRVVAGRRGGIAA